MRRRRRKLKPINVILGYLIAGGLAYWYINRQMKQAALTPEQIAYAKSLPSDLYL